jgi:predicted  nucleic acid-binding Zn-ribbon protein
VDLRRPSARLRQEHPLKADPDVQLRLLDLQELDSQIDTATHRLGTIPEAQRLQDLVLQRKQLDNGVRDLRIRVDDLTTEQKRADADVEQVKGRRSRDQGMIDSGEIGDPKALEHMLDEVSSLNRRISDLEDVELEVMEQLETAQSDLQEQVIALEALDEERTRVQAAFDEASASLQAQLVDVRAQRVVAAEGMPADLITLYDKLREQKNGVGAAELRRRECTGCRLALNAADLRDIAAAPEDDVLRCEECNRILVRTPESGI